MMKSTFLKTLAAFLLLAPSLINAQISTPPNGGNQKSVVTQYMGIASVTITYNSPDVHAPNGTDRTGQIWGGLVPYGYANLGFGLSSEENKSPWRAGANENTTINISHDMLIGNQEVKAGTYGLFMVPGEEDWKILFSKKTDAWGSFFYIPGNAAYKFKTKAVKSEYNEYLTYEFDDRKLVSCTMYLRWENLSVPLKFEIPNIKDLYVDKIRGELTNAKGFNATNWANAASFCATNKINLEEALAWAEYGVSAPFIGQANYTTLSAKAQVLMAMGKKDEALSIFEKAIMDPTANVGAVHNLGRTFIASGDKENALKIFKWNAKAHSNTWPVNVGLMRGYSAVGDYKNALKYCKKAQKNVAANDNTNRDNLKKSEQMLKEGKDIN